MSVFGIVALVALLGAWGTYLLVLALFPTVKVERIEETLNHCDHMRIRAQYDAKTWKDWTGHA